MTPYEQLIKQIEESFNYSNADAEEYAKKLKNLSLGALEEIEREFKMLRIGEIILAIYSLIILLAFIDVDIKQLKKVKDNGWLTVIFIPIIIFLLNIIWRC